ncbi:hypothetical protein OA84_03330 [Kaistella solincola]|uniref:Uncharacterized protein n=1 Tax=Kaistella solincola TaxID=510955 RepID=A0ABR4ZTG8_9FLAO|nr:hypothetical protein OA84_03330 [Kaistella solincola]
MFHDAKLVKFLMRKICRFQGVFFRADISCYPLLLLGWRLRFAPPPPCGVAAAITAAVFGC